jgi:large subunit ribosomal protein L22
MEAHAISRYQRGSAKKLSRIAALIHDQDVPQALNTLMFLNKPTKKPVLKTLQSAVANAVNKAGKAKLDESDLRVAEARVTDGPMLKRWQAGARGMGAMIRRRTAHIYVRVQTREPKAGAKKES